MTKRTNLSLISASALVAGAVAQSSGTQCCSLLSDALPDVVFLPGTDGYTASINNRWSATSVLDAACAFVPASAQDLSTAFGVIVPNQCLFSIKSGGHNPTPGTDSIDGGIAIDMGGFNSVVLSDDQSIATIGAGLHWGDVYAALDGTGVIVPGALEGGPGVGGVCTGGGLAASSPSRGWIVDSVKRWGIVLPSGDIVNASATENADLFLGQKGGSAFAGIVFEIDLATFPLTTLWGGLLAFGLDGPEVDADTMIDASMQAVVDVVTANNNDTASVAYFGQLYASGGAPRSVLAALGNIEDVESPATLQPILDLPNNVQQTLGHFTMAQYANIFTSIQPDGLRQVAAGIVVKADKQALVDVWNAGDALYQSLSFKDDIDWIMLCGLMPEAQETHAAANGGNILGLEDAGDVILWWLSARWTDASLDDAMADARDQWVEAASAAAEQNGALADFTYFNIATPKQDPYCGYGADNVATLRQVAAKYDPLGVMQTLYPGGHKLANANC